MDKIYYLIYIILVKMPDLMLVKPYFKYILKMRRYFLNKLSNITIGNNVLILHNSIITRRSNIILDDDVIIKKDCYLDGNIKIGKKTVILNNTRIDGTGKVIIGNDTHIGRDNNIFSHHHQIKDKNILVNKSEEVPQKTIIGNNVMLYSNVGIMGDVTIEDNVVIAYGSVVTKDCTKNGIYAGIPVKQISQRV